jgi:hypothetical protein
VFEMQERKMISKGKEFTKEEFLEWWKQKHSRANRMIQHEEEEGRSGKRGESSESGSSCNSDSSLDSSLPEEDFDE